jgi:hypothetical protein
MGARAEWKHNKKGLLTKIAVMTAIGVAAGALLSRRGKDEDDEGPKDFRIGPADGSR